MIAAQFGNYGIVQHLHSEAGQLSAHRAARRPADGRRKDASAQQGDLEVGSLFSQLACRLDTGQPAADHQDRRV
jgi:hypothetical protein